MAQSVELLLKIKDVIALLFHLAVIFVVDCIHNLLQLELIAHLCLRSPPFTSCFHDVNTSTLGCYEYEHTPKVRLAAIISEDVLTADVSGVAKCCGNLWVHRDHEVTLLCKRIIAILHLLRHPLSKAVTA